MAMIDVWIPRPCCRADVNIDNLLFVLLLVDEGYCLKAKSLENENIIVVLWRSLSVSITFCRLSVLLPLANTSDLPVRNDV